MEYTEVVYTPPDGAEPTVDIIFVHGLNPLGHEDHAKTTWQHKNKTLWPADLLKKEIPTARCIIFAWNSSILKNSSNTPAAYHAQSLLDGVQNKRNEDKERHRPLIFVAHSMGGLLVKQALVHAQLDETRYSCIRASTYSLVFFATPHRGGNYVTIAQIAAAFCSAITGHPSSSLLKSLERNSLLEEIASVQFGQQMNSYDILSFFEQRKMDIKIEHLGFLTRATALVKRLNCSISYLPKG